MKRLLPLTLLATFAYTGVVLGQSPVTQDASQVAAVDYHYGMNLDIDKVIHITDISDKVGVVSATMTYLDSRGQLHRLNFLQLGGNTQNN